MSAGQNENDFGKTLEEKWIPSPLAEAHGGKYSALAILDIGEDAALEAIERTIVVK